jgi:phage shock protein E
MITRITSILVIGLASVVAAVAQPKLVTAADAKKLIDKEKTKIQVVDVRTPTEWSAGHLAMAKHIDVNDPTFEQKLGTLDKNKPVVVYCAVGGRSGRATIMQQKGFKLVYSVTNGGYRELAATGLPTSTK